MESCWKYSGDQLCICPQCGAEAIRHNLGRAHIMVCDPCRIYWCVFRNHAPYEDLLCGGAFDRVDDECSIEDHNATVATVRQVLSTYQEYDKSQVWTNLGRVEIGIERLHSGTLGVRSCYTGEPESFLELFIRDTDPKNSFCLQMTLGEVQKLSALLAMYQSAHVLTES